MQFKYCPQCGNLDFKQGPNGLVCVKCRYNGPLSEGPMDKINEIRKRARSSPPASPSPAAQGTGINPTTTASELAERLKALKGKSTEDAEFL